ncbi:MAG: hypothetical protein AAGI17_02660 [Planctomycetota bacterium]
MPPGTLDDWTWIASDAAAELVAAAAEADAGDANAITRLRKLVPGERDAITAARLALELAEARRKAVRKALPPDVIADVEGVEMASSHAAAAHVTRRFASAGLPVVDLCSGVGGNAMALADAGLEVTAIDSDPVRAWMTEHNAGCGTHVCDVTDAAALDGVDLEDAVAFADPARRADDRRLRGLDAIAPPFDELHAVLTRFRGAAVKLASSTNAQDLPPGELEIISEISSGRRTLTQAVWWTGSLAQRAGLLTATRLPEGVSISGTSINGPVAALSDVQPGTTIFEIDPAVERVGLLGAIVRRLQGGAIADPGTGLALGTSNPELEPWCTPYRVVEVAPGHPDRLAPVVKQLQPGQVTVRTRGGFIVDPQALAESLRGDSGRELIVFAMRFGDSPAALICEHVGTA